MMRITVIFILICSFVRLSFAQDTIKPKIALVLSGGGAKGFAHIGVLKVLEKENIPIDIIVGTSMGSIVGGLYAIGYSAEDIENMAKTEDWDHLLTDDVSRMQLSPNAKVEKQRFIGSIPVNDKYKPIVPQGLINGQNILNVFCGLTGNVPVDADFSKFPISYACIGTDLETGKEIIINHGFLPTAIFSSMTIPGIFIPVEHNQHYMLDGGLVNNFPTDVAKKMGADIIIGVDIRNNLYPTDEITTIEHLMDQVINFYAIGKDSINKSLCNILIRPDIDGYNVYSFNSRAVDTLIKRGEESALQRIDDIRNLKSAYHLSAKQYSKNLTTSGPWKIDHLTLSGNYSMNNKFIFNNLDLSVPSTLSSKQIQDGIDRLYGLGCFRRVYFKLDPNEDENRTLNIILDQQPYKNINVGMRVNTTDAVSILLNFTQKDYRRFIGLLSVTADISSNPGLNIQTELSKGRLPVFGLQLEGKYGKYTIFLEQKKAYSTEIYYALVKAYTYQNVKNSSLLGIGIREELYKGNIYNSLIDSSINLADNQTAITSLYTYLSIDNLDDYYFPSRGIELYGEFSLSSNEYYNSLNPIALLKNRNIIKLPGDNYFLINLYGRALFTQGVHQFQQTYVGGTDYSIYFNYHLPFYGLPPVAPANMYTFIGQAGLRLKIINNHYISLMGNALFDNDEIYPFDRYDTILGTALSYSIKSRFGPLDFTIGYSDSYRKITLSANAGYWF